MKAQTTLALDNKNDNTLFLGPPNLLKLRINRPSSTQAQERCQHGGNSCNYSYATKPQIGLFFGSMRLKFAIGIEFAIILKDTLIKNKTPKKVHKKHALDSNMYISFSSAIKP